MVQVKPWRTRPVRAGTAVLLAALAVELIDEVVDGTKSAALPLIRQGLALSYGQVGLLASMPLLLGSLLEFPLGALAGRGRGRRLAVLAGGVVFILTLVAAAAARSFIGLLAAFVIFFPASGAFVSLTQSGLMDADPERREQHMARWNLAGLGRLGDRAAAAGRGARGRTGAGGRPTWCWPRSPPPRGWRWPRTRRRGAAHRARPGPAPGRRAARSWPPWGSPAWHGAWSCSRFVTCCWTC